MPLHKLADFDPNYRDTFGGDDVKIKRVRALTLRLLPVEVAPEAIEDPTSRVITPQVIDAYIQAAGDFVHAVGI